MIKWEEFESVITLSLHISIYPTRRVCHAEMLVLIKILQCALFCLFRF